MENSLRMLLQFPRLPSDARAVADRGQPSTMSAMIGAPKVQLQPTGFPGTSTEPPADISDRRPTDANRPTAASPGSSLVPKTSRSPASNARTRASDATTPTGNCAPHSGSAAWWFTVASAPTATPVSSARSEPAIFPLGPWSSQALADAAVTEA